MGQFSKVLLAIDNSHTIIQRALDLWTKLMWVKPGLLARPSHSLCFEYMWHENQHLYQMCKWESA